MKLLPNHVCSIPKGLWGLCNYYKYNFLSLSSGSYLNGLHYARNEADPNSIRLSVILGRYI